MKFRNKEVMDIILNNLEEIGRGSQGICYLNKKTNEVYKIFHQTIDCDPDEYINYTKGELLRFSDVKNKTFMWASDIIYLEDEIIGYITKYVKAKSLYKINPLKINLDKFINSIKQVKKDIKIISENGVRTYDLMYNILYGNKMYVTDFDEFSYSDKDPALLENINNKNFNYELYYFLVDGYFDEFINDYKILRKLYQDKEEDILIFINLLRRYLSEYIGKEINSLNEAKDSFNKRKLKNYTYQREYN